MTLETLLFVLTRDVKISIFVDHEPSGTIPHELVYTGKCNAYKDKTYWQYKIMNIYVWLDELHIYIY